MAGMYLDDISPVAKPGYLLHDNLDDRREIFHLLNRLSPASRLGVLAHACREAVLPNSQVHPFVNSETRRLAEQARWDSAADERLTLTIFWDLWHLSVSFRLDFESLLKRLLRQVRRR